MPFTIFSITIFSIDIVKDKNISFYGNIWIYQEISKEIFTKNSGGMEIDQNP